MVWAVLLGSRFLCVLLYQLSITAGMVHSGTRRVGTLRSLGTNKFVAVSARLAG